MDLTLLHDPRSSDFWDLTIRGAKPNEMYWVRRVAVVQGEEETQGKPLILKSHEECSFRWDTG